MEGATAGVAVAATERETFAWRERSNGNAGSHGMSDRRDAARAKQGRWGAPVLFVLAASIVLVVIAFAIVALVRPW